MQALTSIPPGVRAAWFALALASLVACAAPAPNGAAQSRTDAAPATDTAASVQAPADEAPAASKPAEPPMRTGGPLPPERIDVVAIDATCRSDADCTVKNVGNCCGYYPACVNIDSPTDPKGVQAECAKKGIASVCGFPEISACTCSQGRCEAASGGTQVR